MKLFLDDMLTNVEASQIQITEACPLSLDRIIQHTISNCNARYPVPSGFSRRFHISLVAVIIIGLLATTALAVTAGYYLKTVSYEYFISDDDKILSPAVPDLGISLSIVNVSPTGLQLTCSLESMQSIGAISTDNSYYLETQTDSGWLVVPMLYGHQWQWEEQKLDGDQHTWHIDWTGLYGELAPGNYRIQKPFTVALQDGDIKTYFIHIEFVVDG